MDVRGLIAIAAAIAVCAGAFTGIGKGQDLWSHR